MGCTRWSATTSRSTARGRPAASGSGRCSVSSPTPRSPASTPGRCPARRPSSSATTSASSTTTSRTATSSAATAPRCGRVHGVPQAINTGDTLFSLSRIALHRLTDLGFRDTKVLRLMRLYDETCLALCEGQYIDIAASVSTTLMSVDGYFDMIGRKTAALIAASIEAGALLATDDEDVIARYRGFGWALGIAFQLNDDLLGIWGAEQTTGKEASDVAHRKQTLPVHLRARERPAPRTARASLELYAAPDRTARGGRRVRGILERTGAREYTRDQAHRYRDEALAELDAAGVVSARPPGRASADHRRRHRRLRATGDAVRRRSAPGRGTARSRSPSTRAATRRSSRPSRPRGSGTRSGPGRRGSRPPTPRRHSRSRPRRRPTRRA